VTGIVIQVWHCEEMRDGSECGFENADT
jgi:hypothetical protein